MTTGKPGSGRPRDTATTTRILAMAWDVLAAQGIDGLDIEALAAKIPCAKTTIYRRWPTRDDLVAAAIEAGLNMGTDPATGDVVTDLVEFTMANVGNYSSRFSGFALAEHSEVTRKLWERVFSHRQRIAIDIIDRARTSNQITQDADALAIIDLLSGFVSFRLVARAAVHGEAPTLTREDVRRVVTAIVASPPLLSG